MDIFVAIILLATDVQTIHSARPHSKSLLSPSLSAWPWRSYRVSLNLNPGLLACEMGIPLVIRLGRWDQITRKRQSAQGLALNQT